jgi:Restriction endonuclease BglII
VKEQKDANGGAAVRKLIDARFELMGGWSKRQTGAVDWTKCQLINGTKVCVGVEVQFSARSDLLVMDIVHLRREIISGDIDVGVLVVPSDRLGGFLTDRAPRFSDAVRHVAQARADDMPLLIMAVEHDGPGEALAKQPKGLR